MKKLLDYIQGKKGGKEAHDLEREAMQDPFLKDALEGYENVNGNHLNNIKSLQEKISQKTKQKKSYNNWYIAASILILISGGSYFLIQNYNVNNPKELAHNNYDDGQSEVTVIDHRTRSSTENDNSKYNYPLEPKSSTKIVKEKKYLIEELSQTKKDEITESKDTFYEYLAFQDNREVKNMETPMIVSSPISIEETKALSKQSLVNSETDSFKIQEQLKDYGNDMPVGKESIAMLDRYSERDMKKEKKRSKVTLKGIALEAQTLFTAFPVIGISEYNQYLHQNISLTNTEESRLVKGTVIVQFTVNAKGRPDNIKVLQSLCEDIDNQLIKLIENGADWKGGNQGQIQFTK